MQESPHHGDRWFKEATEQAKAREAIDALTKNLTQIAKLGETGQYPHGAMTPDDEGEIRFAVTAEAGKVILAFGKSIEWIGMTPRLARELADKLSEYAARA